MRGLFLAPALLLTPRLLTPRLVHHVHLRASDNATLTVGDALIGSLSRQISKLPDSEQAARASRTLDAMIDASKSEIDEVKKDLLRDLRATEVNTSSSLRDQLTITETVFLRSFNRTAVALDDALAPSRRAVRAELDTALSEAAARREAKRKAISRLGLKGSSTWRDEQALARFSAKPTHPIVRVCEASALAMSVLLVLAAGDVASSQRRMDSPPRAHVHMRAPRLTGEYTEVYKTADAPSADDTEEAWAEVVAAAAAPSGSPATTLDDSAGSAPARAAHWWAAMRWTLLAYLMSLGAIMVRAGLGDEWAVLALGIAPEEGGDGTPGTMRKLVNWEYDWENDRWREG